MRSYCTVEPLQEATAQGVLQFGIYKRWRGQFTLVVSAIIPKWYKNVCLVAPLQDQVKHPFQHSFLTKMFVTKRAPTQNVSSSQEIERVIYAWCECNGH